MTKTSKKKKKSIDFEYTYVAPTNEERKEIENIKNSYLSKKETESQTKLSRLRSLDMKVKNTPGIIALTFGIIGILIFGLGLSIILEIKTIPMFIGIICAIVGTILMIVAHPINKMVYNNLKKKYGPQIISLSEELLNEKPNIEFKD